MKIVEEVLERQIQTLINLKRMHLGFMPAKETMGTIFIVRRMQEAFQKQEKKLYMCFVDIS